LWAVPLKDLGMRIFLGGYGKSGGGGGGGGSYFT